MTHTGSQHRQNKFRVAYVTVVGMSLLSRRSCSSNFVSTCALTTVRLPLCSCVRLFVFAFFTCPSQHFAVDFPQWSSDVDVPCVENPELWNSLPLKPAVGQHAEPSARNFILFDFYMPGPFKCLSFFFFLFLFVGGGGRSVSYFFISPILGVASKDCN